MQGVLDSIEEHLSHYFPERLASVTFAHEVKISGICPETIHITIATLTEHSHFKYLLRNSHFSLLDLDA